MIRILIYRIMAAMTLMLMAAAPVFAATPTVRIQVYPGLAGLLGRVMVANGYCVDHGIHCKLVSIPSAPLGVQTLAAGGIDVATSSPAVAVQAVIHGLKIKLISIGVSRSLFMLVVGKDLKGVATAGYPAIMHDLKGKTIGVTALGAAPEFLFRTMLKGAGMSPDAVTFVAVGPPATAYPALVSGKVDAAMSFTPMAAICKVEKTCSTALMLAKNQGPEILHDLPTSFFMVRSSYAKEHPDTVKAIVAAFHDSAKYANNPSNLDGLLAIVEKSFTLALPHGEEALRSALQLYQPYYSAGVNKAAVKKVVNYLYKSGQIKEKLSPAKLLQ